jgi:integrase
VQRKLTDALLRGVKAPSDGRLEYSDAGCAGLSFRMTARGVASWNFRYRDPITRRTTRATIGSYPTIGLKAARAKADELRKADDPGAAKREALRGAAAKTFGHLATRYVEEHAKRKKRSWRADERNLRKHVLPRWKSRAYASIARADVIELLEAIVASGRLTLANRIQSLVSKVFAFAIDADLLATSPAFRLARRGVERARRRVLSDDEIRLFWPRVVEAPISWQTGQALRLALLTGVRVGELAGISRDELENIQDADKALWIVPGERTKNKLPHAVPLAPTARAIVLELLATLESGGRYLFPHRTRPRAPMPATSLSNAMTRLGVAIGGEGDTDAHKTWRADPIQAHDTRRTLNTRAAAFGVPKEIRDRLLNHAPAKSDTERRNYNAYDFLPEKRRALTQWDSALAAILSDRPAVVVPISKGRRR